ncbi:MAG: hypothetical protein MUE40_08950 [Anaerolineae bacterium]|nr:hypothetical protein [Anaerolineae bacterium]
MSDTLQQIRDLQFTDVAAAEALLLAFIQANFPALAATAVQLTPKPTSLNSFNGLLTQADGTRRFFKTHTESHTIINEYYNAELLAQAGYPIIQPIFRSTEPGKQFLVYEVIDDPAVFDLAWAIENGDETLFPALTAAQQQADDALSGFYTGSHTVQPAGAAADAPIHQLFYHRLTGGRQAQFYADDIRLHLPAGSYPMREVRRWRWRINGQHYAPTLDEISAGATRTLHPGRGGLLVRGHGDAHNGNVFFQAAQQRLLYFDPAFAGQHNPYLDLAKPLFHNVFAMWMYFPQDIRRRLTITMRLEDGVCQVDYAYPLHPVRQMFLESKIERVLRPLLTLAEAAQEPLAARRALLKAALFCCPFLTMNLTDSGRFPPEISLLGLAMAVEMGAESQGTRSLIDTVLDQAGLAVSTGAR